MNKGHLKHKVVHTVLFIFYFLFILYLHSYLLCLSNAFCKLFRSRDWSFWSERSLLLLWCSDLVQISCTGVTTSLIWNKKKKCSVLNLISVKHCFVTVSNRNFEVCNSGKSFNFASTKSVHMRSKSGLFWHYCNGKQTKKKKKLILILKYG